MLPHKSEKGGGENVDYSKITRIEDLDDAGTANEYLALGWVVLQIYTTAYDTEPPRCFHQKAHYVMGWFDGEPTYPKRDIYGQYI